MCFDEKNLASGMYFYNITKSQFGNLFSRKKYCETALNLLFVLLQVHAVNYKQNTDAASGYRFISPAAGTS